MSSSTQCAGLSEATSGGSVVWADGQRMWEATADGSVRCLFETAGDITTMQWGPQGDRVLINGSLVVGGPFEGSELPPNTEWKFSYPTGKNLVGIDENGSIVKFISESSTTSVIDPITLHDAVTYHPSGLHIAVSGDQVFDESLDPSSGIFITNSDGTEPVNLAASSGASIIEMAFTNDASAIYFIADHDGTRHLHGNSVIPFELEDGTLQLGQGAEDVAATVAESTVDAGVIFDTVLVHPSDPTLVAWSTDICAPGGALGFQVFAAADLTQEADNHRQLLEILGPAAALGFIGADPSMTSMAIISGSCDGPRDVGLATASADTGDLESTPLAGNATAAAVRAVVTPHQWDLVDVTIAGFA